MDSKKIAKNPPPHAPSRPKHPMPATIAMIFGLLALYIPGTAADWPAWRGPHATGSVDSGNPPIHWSETENVKWKVPVPGTSSSTPIIIGDRLVFQTAINLPGTEQGSTGGESRRSMSRRPAGDYNFDLVCLDRHTGQTLWQTTVCKSLPHEGHHPDHGFASFSPVTDGTHLWASFGSRGVYCLDLDGNLVWSREMPPMKMRAGFGEGSSPALAGDALIVVADQEGDSFIYALDKKSGDILWKRERDEQTSWSTPVVLNVNDRLQVVVNATNFVRSYDVKTGEVVWQCSGQTENVIPTPVPGDGMIYCTSGYRGSNLMAIRADRTGDLSGTDAIAWQVDKDTPYVPSPLLHDGRIYVLSANRGVVSCFRASDGTPLFQRESLEGIRSVYASPIGVQDRIYFAGREGAIVVLKAADKLEILATNTLDDGFDASPVVVGDQLYLKGKNSIYLIAQ